VTIPEEVTVPSESSLTPVIMLLERLHGVDLGSGNLVDSDLVAPEVGWLQSNDSGRLDLKAASDLVTPAAALLAIGGGGKIVGVGHTQRKESKRMATTQRLLSYFGLKSEIKSEGIIEVPGGQSPMRPEEDVKTFSDHRVAMTAMALASLVGATIEGEGCIGATHPSFHQMLMAISS
jgi:5-enolpyruvylshikimate-3-phosphate synthase